MNKLMIGAGVAALLAVPALALHGGGDHHGAKGPTTRAELLAKVQERFVKVDADKDGAITRAEFDAHRATMKAEHEARRAQRRAEHFAELDTDKSGQLSKEEFSAPRSEGERHGHRGMHHGGWGKMHGMGMGGGEGWFDRLDANKDGRVTLAEAQAVPLAMFNKADVNKDGTVTPEERKAAWEAMRGEWKAKGS
jgi:Ca2+-binding EF-hand superfamily protein